LSKHQLSRDYHGEQTKKIFYTKEKNGEKRERKKKVGGEKTGVARRPGCGKSALLLKKEKKNGTQGKRLLGKKKEREDKQTQKTRNARVATRAQ